MQRVFIRSVCAACLVALWPARPAPGQEPPGRDVPEVKRLQAELERLRDQAREAEARLKQAQAAAERKPGPGAGDGHHGPDLLRLFGLITAGVKAEWDARGSITFQTRVGSCKAEWETRGWVRIGPGR